MKNGYYLSTYLYINQLAYLTKKELRHDQSVALWKKENEKIELVHYWELERVTGLKQHRRAFYDVQQAKTLINHLLEEYNLIMDDMVEVWGTPELDTVCDYHSIQDYNNLCYHSLCHLYSSMLMDTDIYYHDNMLSFAIDGAPDNLVDVDIENKEYYAGCYSENGEIKDMFPVYSPGVIWNLAKIRYNLREGSLMALASASQSKLFSYTLEDYLIANVKDMASVTDCVNEFFDYIDQLTEEDAGVKFNYLDSNFSFEDNKISMAIKVIQEYSLLIMCKNIDDAVEKHNIDVKNTYLCMSGGYALNCPTNSYLMNRYHFKGFVANPCVSDSGLALGIGLYAFYKKSENHYFEFKFDSAYYGDVDDSLQSVAETYSKYVVSVEKADYKKIVEDIKGAPIVWFNGRAESGPRSLGDRSLIADPRSEKAKDALNQVKIRQWWRPVAPIVLENKVKDWFDDSYKSPYMLHTFYVKEECASKVPAILHLDNSARVQTVTEKENKEIYELIRVFEEETNVPILCNTSLNDRGEPIINSIEEAFNFIIRKHIKVGYFNGYRVEFHNFDEYSETEPSKRKYDVDSYIDDETRKKQIEELNPFHVSDELLTVYVEHPRLYQTVDLKTKRGVRILEGIGKMRMARFHMD